MRNYILFDGPYRTSLRPLTDNKPVAYLTIGATTIKEKWDKALKLTTTLLSEPEFEALYPPLLMDSNVFIHAAVLPSSNLVEAILQLQAGQQLVKGDEVIAFVAEEEDDDMDLPDFQNIQFDGEIVLLSDPIQIIKFQAQVLHADIDELKELIPLKETTTQDNWLTHPKEVFIAEGVQCKHVFINAESGPVLIDENAVIMEGAMLRGPLYIGKGAVVKMGAKLYGGTYIGKKCVVAGEVKNSIVMDYANKGHEGYIGDAIIGSWCNLGADTNASNLKNNLSAVSLWDDAENDFVAAETLKCGVIMGDYCLTAIQTAINTATKIGCCSQVFGRGLTPKLIPPFSFGFESQKVYEIDKCIETVRTLKNFKNETLTDNEANMLRALHQKYNT